MHVHLHTREPTNVKLNKAALAMHQKAGLCRALWRLESDRVERGQDGGRKEGSWANDGVLSECGIL